MGNNFKRYSNGLNEMSAVNASRKKAKLTSEMLVDLAW